MAVSTDASQPPGDAALSGTRPRRPPRLLKLLLLGLVLAGVAWGVRESPWVREYQYRKANLQTLESWAAASPRDALLYYYLGTQYHNAGILPEALSAFQRAAVIDPKLARAHVGIAAVSISLERVGPAQEAARQAVALDPRSVDAHMLLAIATYPESKSKALPEFQKVTQLAPERADAWHWAGRCSRELNDFSGALEPLRTAAKLEPKNGRYTRDLGADLLDLGKLDEARGILEQAVKLAPEDAEANYLLARQIVNTSTSAEELKRAEAMMARSIKLLDPGDTRNKAAIMVEQAEVLRRLKRPREALGILLAARKTDPSHTRILHYLGLTARELGRDAEAERYLLEFSRLSKQTKELSNMEQRVRQDMKNPALRLRMARLYAEAGKLPQAVNQYDMCLYLQPKNQDAKREKQALLARAQAMLKRAAATAPPSGSPSPAMTGTPAPP